MLQFRNGTALWSSKVQCMATLSFILTDASVDCFKIGKEQWMRMW